MADVLSQNEIDSLLTEMTVGAVDVDSLLQKREPIRNDLATYDFRRPNRISKNQVRQIQTVHENFAEIFGYYLVSRLQTIVSISVTAVDQLFYSEFILSVANPSCIYVFDIAKTDGTGILEISPQLALTIVERLLGGSADIVRKPRSITPIEQAVMRKIIDHAFGDLSSAWHSIADLQFAYQRLETESEFVQIAPSSEIVVLVSFDVNIGINQYLMNLCFPTFALEDVLARLNRQQVTSNISQTPQRVRENMDVMKRQIAQTRLPVVAELGKAVITVQDLLGLKVGDVLKLDAKIDSEIELSIGQKRKYAARPGTLDGKKAIKITRELKEEDLIETEIYYRSTEK